MSEVTIVYSVDAGYRKVVEVFEDSNDAADYVYEKYKAHPPTVFYTETWKVTEHKKTSQEYLESHTDEENKEYLNNDE